MGFGMAFGWIAFFVIIGIAVYSFNQTGGDEKRQKSAQDILDERYARGELSEQEYKEMSNNLKEH